MSLKLNHLLAAAAAAAFAFPAAAQDAAVEADAQAEVQAGDAAVDADVAAEADAAAQPAPDGQGGPDGEAAGEAAAGGIGEVVVATAADLRAGAIVQDPQGGMVGTVEEVDGGGAVVSTGNVRARMPLESFGKNDRGLVISMTRAEFEAAVAAQNPS